MVLILMLILMQLYNCIALLFVLLLLFSHSSSPPSLLSSFHSVSLTSLPHHPLGCSVYFCQPDALKGSLTVTMREVRPTLFFSVPRVWEKIQEKMAEMGRKTTGIKKVTINEGYLFYCYRIFRITVDDLSHREADSSFETSPFPFLFFISILTLSASPSLSSPFSHPSLSTSPIPFTAPHRCSQHGLRDSGQSTADSTSSAMQEEPL